MELKTILNRPHKMLSFGLLLLISMFLLGFVAAKKQITILADGDTIKIETRSFKPKSALKEAGIILADNDGYRLINKKKLEDGAAIEVIRAMPIKVWQEGTMKEYSIGRGTVKEVLEALNIDYKGKKVFPAPEQKPSAGLEILLLAKDARLEEERQPIPFSVERKQDSHLPLDEERTIAEGVTGEKLVTYSYIEINGQKEKKALSTTVLSEPQPRIVAVGTNRTVQTSRGAVNYRVKKIMEATAYTLECGDGDGVTSIGLVPKRGIIAVDPDVIPYGTKVYIPGYGFAMAGDCGGAIVGNRIDLFMDSYHEAITFGRRNVEMYIL